MLKTETITADSPEFKKLKSKGKNGSSAARDEFFFKLMVWLKERNIAFISEFRFLSGRKYRFDLALILNPTSERKSLKIGIEYEGIMPHGNKSKSRHTTITGYTNDLRKYNLCQIHGFILLRYTVLNKDEVYNDLEMLLK